ncbi:cupin domain-containing protein [Sediminicoccus sp. BL-A-41-H5]|uniref:cupin domain-containing protein n=1 Tax=Sediminicoccus sp. BL-A-41-H5 TaxID=3421106 RepID=UPI003D66D820
MSRFVFPLAEAMAAPPEPGRISARIFGHGSLQLRWYAPRGEDPQGPHEQDEVYVVVTGQGWFRRGEERLPFGPGDAIFVPAHVPHRFEDFSPDLGVWVMFTGPPGGEAA